MEGKRVSWRQKEVFPNFRLSLLCHLLCGQDTLVTGVVMSDLEIAVVPAGSVGRVWRRRGGVGSARGVWASAGSPGGWRLSPLRALARESDSRCGPLGGDLSVAIRAGRASTRRGDWALGSPGQPRALDDLPSAATWRHFCHILHVYRPGSRAGDQDTPRGGGPHPGHAGRPSPHGAVGPPSREV